MWQKLNTFINVAEQASFAKTAEKLGLSKATVTRYIQELEEEYQTKLFIRTTRHLSLTEQGETFLQYAEDLLELNQETQATLNHSETSAKGNIKIGMPTSILHQFCEHGLSQLAKQYPELSIEIIQGNHLSNLHSNHFDLVLHCGILPDVNFYYEKIADWQKILCASPNFLKKHGTPKTIEDLRNFQCLDHADNHSNAWLLREKDKTKPVAIKGQIKVNSSLAIKELAIQGNGIAYLPSFTVNDAIQKKKLTAFLENTWQEPLGIYALFPLRKRFNKKVSIIIEALKSILN